MMNNFARLILNFCATLLLPHFLWGRAIAIEDTQRYQTTIDSDAARAAFSQIAYAPQTTTPTLTSTLSSTIDLAKLNTQIIAEQISDHTLELKDVQGIPVYTWNILAHNSPSGFGPTFVESPALFEARLQKQFSAIATLLTANPHAVVCLQEFTNHPSNSYHKLLGRALQKSSTNLTFAYNNFASVGSGKFGIITIYNKHIYSVLADGASPGGAFSAQASAAFQSTTYPQQNTRVLKVILQNNQTKQEISVVNAHLEWGKVSKQLLDELAGYAARYNSTTVPFVITGDFNYNLGYYTPTASNITVTPAGSSYSWDKTTNSPKKNLTDGFIFFNE